MFTRPACQWVRERRCTRPHTRTVDETNDPGMRPAGDAFSAAATTHEHNTLDGRTLRYRRVQPGASGRAETICPGSRQVRAATVMMRWKSQDNTSLHTWAQAEGVPLVQCKHRIISYWDTTARLDGILRDEILERGKRRTNPCLYTVVLYNNLLLLLQMHRRERWRGCSAGISRLVLTYFLSQNTIHSTSRVLFILPAEHPRGFRILQVRRDVSTYPLFPFISSMKSKLSCSVQFVGNVTNWTK
jgi:hypothetical protein